ncbi:AAA family ATPase [Kiloniella majae]|uniref:AAA family ATPase n=1 Tax=Kiloniella majae TaxID=1938558 RepID=UPI000A278DF6|nr:ATP-binding protein [Kiloniella majae]
MQLKFIKTENVKRLALGLQAIEERGAGEACIMVVEGEPGLGKTEATTWLATENDCLFVRAKREWTPSWMLKELLEQLNVMPAHSFQSRFEQLLEALSNRAQLAQSSRDLFAVVIDEVDYISRCDKMLSTLRDLSDFLEIPFILVGMGRLRTNLKRFPQVTSRVGQYVDFHPLGREDVGKMVTGLCDVPVKDDLIDLIHELSRGYVREIKEAIAHVERFARRQGMTKQQSSDQPLREIGRGDMIGQVLMNDRATSKPILVRG